MKKANAQQFRKLLERTTPLPISPEVRLIIGVLTQAWADVDDTSQTYAWGATKFFMDGRASLYAETIGIDGEFVKEMFLKHNKNSHEASA
jgi:hypothetical protein